MKMKMVITSLFLTSLLLVSCTPKSNSNTNMSIQDVPTAKELREWESTKINKLRFQIEQIPLDSCEEYFANEVKTFLNTYETVELENLTIKQDNLSVIKGKNRKSLSNLEFEVSIIIDMTGNVGNNKFAKEISNQLLHFLQQYSYYNLKTCRTVINSYDLYHTKFYDLECAYSSSYETIFAEQPKDEFAVQTLASNFSERNPNIILQKFGVIPENNELYVEYYVSDDYFDFSNIESSIAELDQIVIDLKEYLMAENVTKKYILSNGVNLLTISFWSGNFDDTYLTFHFEL